MHGELIQLNFDKIMQTRSYTVIYFRGQRQTLCDIYRSEYR